MNKTYLKSESLFYALARRWVFLVKILSRIHVLTRIVKRLIDPALNQMLDHLNNIEY